MGRHQFALQWLHMHGEVIALGGRGADRYPYKARLASELFPNAMRRFGLTAFPGIGLIIADPVDLLVGERRYFEEGHYLFGRFEVVGSAGRELCGVEAGIGEA